MKTTLRILTLILLATLPLNSSAQIVPEYSEPFHTIPKYSNINAEVIQKAFNNEPITPLQEKIVSCSFYTDKLGTFMKARQEGLIPLTSWLNHPDTTEEEAKLISLVYTLPMGTNLQTKLYNLRTFVDSTFADCMAK